MQKEIITALVMIILLYLLYAILHYTKDRRLTFTIFLEYLLTAAIALILVMGVQF